MFFSSAFHVVPICLQLLLSILALFFIATKWEKSSAKKLMLAMIVFGFLLPSLLAIIGTLVYSVVAYQGTYGYSPGYQLVGLLAGIISFAGLLLPLLSLVMLFIYIFHRQRLDSERSSYLQAAVSDSETEQHPYVAMGFIPAKAWNTDVDPKVRISILRKREWAFLIDVLPAITFNICCLWVIFKIGNAYGHNPWEELLSALFGFATLGLIIYLPFKDSIAGVSFGKRISKCRVVRTRDGAPIGVGESLARNVLFLIPFMALVELAVASLRPDRRRLGDLLARTTVVTGEPDFVGGAENQNKQAESEEEKPPAPHPLDD